MVHGEVAGLKNGEPVMAGVLEEGHRDKMVDRSLRGGPAPLRKFLDLPLRVKSPQLTWAVSTAEFDIFVVRYYRRTIVETLKRSLVRRIVEGCLIARHGSQRERHNVCLHIGL